MQELIISYKSLPFGTVDKRLVDVIDWPISIVV